MSVRQERVEEGKAIGAECVDCGCVWPVARAGYDLAKTAKATQTGAKHCPNCLSDGAHKLANTGDLQEVPFFFAERDE